MKKRYLPLAIVSAGIAVFAGSLLFAQAQTTASTTVQGDTHHAITFPIAELGGCASQTECRSYCDQSAHRDACIAFGQKHNLISSEDAQEGKVISEIERSGGPGGCHSQSECSTYCQDHAHATECTTFAQKHGLLKGRGLEQAKLRIKLEAAMAQGEAPGACTTKDACESYCHDQAHAAECVAFAEKMGMTTKEESDAVQKDHGAGPGGCTSRDACEAFCSDLANQSVCLAFAKDHGLARDGDIRNIKDSVNRVRSGLDNAPFAVKTCLATALGTDVLAQVMDDSFVPDPALGGKIQACFAQNQGVLKTEFKSHLNANPELRACLKSGIGEQAILKVTGGDAPPSPEAAMVMKGCFEKFGRLGSPERPDHGGPENGMPPPRSDGNGTSTNGGPKMGVDSANKERIVTCVAAKLGLDPKNIDTSKIAASPELQAAIKACLPAPRGPGGTMMLRSEGDTGPGGMSPRENQPGLPPPIRACVVGLIGEDTVKGFEAGGQPTDISSFKNAIRECVEKIKPPMAPSGTGDDRSPQPGGGAVRPGMPSMSPPDPSQLQDCIAQTKEELNTQEITAEFKAKVAECMQAPPPPQMNDDGTPMSQSFMGKILGSIPGVRLLGSAFTSLFGW